MKAVVFHGVGDIRLDDVPEPVIQDPGDAIVRLTASAICGTDRVASRLDMAREQGAEVIGEAMSKNVTLRMGNCHHRRYIPMLVAKVRADVIAAYEAFDQRRHARIKVGIAA